MFIPVAYPHKDSPIHINLGLEPLPSAPPTVLDYSRPHIHLFTL